MRVLYGAFLAVLAAVVHSQAAALPACAQSCLSRVTGCSATDNSCFCQAAEGNSASTFGSCVVTSCSDADFNTYLTALENACINESGINASESAIFASVSSMIALDLSSVGALVSSRTVIGPSVGPISISSNSIAPNVVTTTAGPIISTISESQALAPMTSQSISSAIPTITASVGYAPIETNLATSTGAGGAGSPQSIADGGLSTGAKVGIGVSVAFVVILAILGALFCLTKRSQRREQRDQQDLEISPIQNHEMLTSSNIHEMDGNSLIAEKLDDERFAELSASGANGRGLGMAGGLEMTPLPAKGDVPPIAELQSSPNVYEMLAVAELHS